MVIVSAIYVINGYLCFTKLVVEYDNNERLERNLFNYMS